MGIFSRFKKINSEEVKSNVIQKEAAKKSFLFVVGTLISALSYNLFYVPNHFVGGGIGGFGIVLNHFFDIDPKIVILVFNVIFLIASIIVLGFSKSLLSIIGATTSTLFVYLTVNVVDALNFSFDNILLSVIAAGVVGGFGEALVYKAGFNTGGTSILALIIQHYRKKPMGYLIRVLSIGVIILGGFAFGYTSVMYSILITFIATYMVDKILLGISESKMFYIHTDKEEEVKDFIIKVIESGVTEFDTHGAYTKKKKKILMCVVPTERYTLLKSAIKEIDSGAFIVVSDCYEVLGGTERKKLDFD